MNDLTLLSTAVLLATFTMCCADATENAWQVDPEALADKLNAERERPDGPHEWDNCDVEGFGGIEPVHACTYPHDGYAPKCVWYAGRRMDDGEWAPLNADTEGELGAVCVCNVSEFHVDKVCAR